MAYQYKIAVNTRVLIKDKMDGIGYFTQETLIRIVRSHPDIEFHFLFDRPYDRSFIFADNVVPVVLHPPTRHPLLWYIWFEWSVTRYLAGRGFDLFLSPDGHCSLSTETPTLTILHDIAYEHYPHYVPWLTMRYYRHFIPRFMRYSRRIATVSDYSKADIAQYYHIPLDKIDVVYNGAHEEYKPLDAVTREEVKKKYANGCEYFVFAGALHPRKNIVNLLKAFVVFKKRQHTNMKLVIVGRMAWKYEEVEQMQAEMQFKEDVKWVGYMNIDELSKVIGAAYALVYASLFEGFGIPILEALQCDVPAIVSNTSSMPEVAGDAALLVDPTDVNDIADKMHLIYKDETLRNKLIVNARVQVKKFDWERSAKNLWASMMKTLE